MAEKLKLRAYQQECIDAVFASWSEGTRRPAAVLPTGAGKTVIFSSLTQRFGQEEGKRVLILVHREELADQAIAKLKQTSPYLDVGKIKAHQNDIQSDVMVASVQTLARSSRLEALQNTEENWGEVGLIITDECHHGSAPSYKKIYEAFPDAFNVGFTATLARGDKRGLGDVWDEVVYSRSVLNMIKNKYLVDVKAKKVDIEGLNLEGVQKSRGDYQASDLGEALQGSGAMEQIASAYVEHAKDRQGIVFTPTVATAWDAKTAFDARGLKTAVISGETPREERLKIFEDFRTGRVQTLANCMVLTEGFDAPWASCAVIARPTQSQPLYVQMVGRVLRTWPGKSDALVLDVTGVGGMRLKTLMDLEPGSVREMREGESLEEAVEREASEAPTKPQGSSLQGLKFQDHDLFAASEVHWLKTEAGVLFIAAGKHYVLLWPSRHEGLWDVCCAPESGKWARLREGLPIEMAMAWGEADAEDYSDFSVKSSAKWRTAVPSPSQKGFATRLGIEGVDQMRRGAVADAISVKLASRKLDRFLPFAGNR